MPASRQPDSDSIRWKFHPRVFASLGADLVTNDLVALVELVKNAYDAFAHNVDIRFAVDEKTQEQELEIYDDGVGMDHETLLNAWFMVGTPYRTVMSTAGQGRDLRRVTGEKGLGRLSAARLGDRLQMYTMKEGDVCYRSDVDWEAIARADNISECTARLVVTEPPKRLGSHGTLIRITKLRRRWNFTEDTDISELRNELARFVPPFGKRKDFTIRLHIPGDEQSEIEIRHPEFLNQPDYTVKGEVNNRGIAHVEYLHGRNGSERRSRGAMRLTDAEPKLVPESMISIDKAIIKTECGPFTFEFRVWDLDSDSLLSLAERFNLEKKVRTVRNQISENPFSGISVYRDGIIVLPKVTSAARRSGVDRKTADAGRDWLGLNLRRVSRVGKRISVNQVVGYVDVSADSNPGLRDTSDRERLVDNEASRQFKEFLFKIVWFLEAEREKDRIEPEHQEPPLQDLFEGLKSPRLVARIAELEKRSAGWEDIRGAIDEHRQELESAVDEIQSRFYYYSRLATVGSLALLLQHEVGNKVSVIEELLKHLRESTEVPLPSRTEKRLQLAESSVRSLQRLADTFAPLATRTFGTRRRDCLVEDVLNDIRGWHEKELAKEAVLFKVKSDGNNNVAVDPGELAAIFENLTTNSLYWLRKIDTNNRQVLVEVQPNRKAQRVNIAFHDSGPGVEDGYEEMIFWPGVTKKEGGIGMGLTVASELVAQHGGKMYLMKPGKLGGASFGFDLPYARR